MKYEEEALSTLSNKFHYDLVSPTAFCNRIENAIKAANSIDELKKTLFYGKPCEPIAPGIGDERSLEAIMIARSSDDIDFIHGVLGVFSEAGELLELLVDSIINNKPIDLVNLNEENGDCMWYQAILAKVGKQSFEQTQTQNIAKLKARYPDKFTEHDALNRDLEGERRVLEG